MDLNDRIDEKYGQNDFKLSCILNHFAKSVS